MHKINLFIIRRYTFDIWSRVSIAAEENEIIKQNNFLPYYALYLDMQVSPKPLSL